MPLPTTVNELIIWMAENNLPSPFTDDPEENRLNWYHSWSSEQRFQIINGVVIVFGFPE